MNRRGLVLALACLVGAMLYPLVATTHYMQGTGVLILLYGGMAIAWNILTGYAGQNSFGHAAWFGLGAYTSGLLTAKLGLSPWLGMVVAALLAAAISWLLGAVTFRLKGIYFGLATFAFSLILEVLARHFKFTGGDIGLTVPISEDSLVMLQFRSQIPYYYVALALVVLYLAVSYLMYHGKFGYYMRAVRDDEGAAGVMGVNVFRVKLYAYAVSAAMTAIMGSFYVQLNLFVDPRSGFGMTQSVAIMLGAIVGGVGSIWGPVLGAAVIQGLIASTNALGSGAGSRGGEDVVLYALMLIVIVLVLPGGLVSIPQLLRSRRKRGTVQPATGGSHA